MLQKTSALFALAAKATVLSLVAFASIAASDVTAITDVGDTPGQAPWPNCLPGDECNS